jgi:hypothetical protein
MSIWSALFLDLSIDEVVESQVPLNDLLYNFEVMLRRDEITLSADIESDGKHISVAREGLIKAYYTSGSLLTAQIRVSETSHYRLTGSITVGPKTRALLQGVTIIATIMCLLLFMKDLVGRNWWGVWFAFKIELYVVALIFGMSLLNFSMAQNQKKLITKAFFDAAATRLGAER